MWIVQWFILKYKNWTFNHTLVRWVLLLKLSCKRKVERFLSPCILFLQICLTKVGWIGISKCKKRVLVIERGSVSIRSIIEHLALRDGKINKILTLLFGNLCPVKGGPHLTIIISHRYFNRSISCAIKKKWCNLSLPESLSHGSRVFIKSLHLPCPALVRVSFLLVFYQGHPIFWYFPIASRMNDIPTLTMSFRDPLIWPQLWLQPLAF